MDRESKTALLIGIAIPLTFNLSNTEAGKTKKDKNVSLEIKNVLKLHNAPIYPVFTTAERAVTRKFLNSREHRFNQKRPKSGKNSSTIKKVSYSTQIPKDSVFSQLCGCFGNTCTCIYCVFVLLPLLYLFLFVTSVRTTATE
jgi:hypothetical protein